MRAHELFRLIPTDLADEILTFLREEERDAYKSTLASLAANKRLRPVFVQRKSVPEQFTWMRDNLALKTSNDIAEHLLQVFLLTRHSDMLIAFLNGVGIEHDGKGEVETDLPETLNPKKLGKTVTHLLKKYPAPLVSLYLHAFLMQNPGGWPELADLLQSDERLCLEPGEPGEPGDQ